MRRVVASFGLVLSMGLALLPSISTAQDTVTFPEDTIAVGLTGSATPNIDVTVELSRATFADSGATRVLIGRSDVFADSLASGVLQSDRPLLLVPTDGPVPPAVRDEITRLGATSATLLGGEVAVSAVVADELTGMGLTVDRLSGATRIETAVAVAQTTSAATTAILARAGGVEGNPTSGFADALAAGGWAAATGWPVLLSQTDQLTTSTAEFLASSSITAVQIVGGTAAIGQGVADALTGMGMTVTRVSGADRAATAIEIAKSRGVDTAADAGRVIVVDGFSEDAWAAGFAAAAQAAGGAVDPAGGQRGAGRDGVEAPIVLGNVENLPPATEGFLQPGPTSVTCAVSAAVCDAARVQLGFAPAVAQPLPPGSITYTVANETSSLLWQAQFDGSGSGLAFPCVDQYCTEVDFEETGERAVMAVQRPGVDDDGVYQLGGQTLGDVGSGLRDFGDDTGGIDASDNIQDNPLSFISFNDGFLLQDAIGGAAQSGAGPGGAIQPSFQARNRHPSLDPPSRSSTLYLTGGDELLITTNIGLTAHIQRRAEAQVLGAAWAPNGSGDIAMVDQIANIGSLRIAAYPDGAEVEAANLDANSTPFWLPDSSTVVVLADTDNGVSLVAVDAGSGAQTVLVEDAGIGSAGGRIDSDGSGTLIAWRAGDEVRAVNTTDGTVASLPVPEGYQVVGGPAIRP